MKIFSKRKPEVNRQRRGGKFVKGCSGNPAGRPKGIMDKRVQLRELLEPSKEKLVKKAVSLALRGDTAALRLCLERLIPAYRPTNELIQMPIPVKDNFSVQAMEIFNRILIGELSSDDGQRLFEMLTARIKIHEITDLEQRLLLLEEKAKAEGERP